MGAFPGLKTWAVLLGNFMAMLALDNIVFRG